MTRSVPAYVGGGTGTIGGATSRMRSFRGVPTALSHHGTRHVATRAAGWGVATGWRARIAARGFALLRRRRPSDTARAQAPGSRTGLSVGAGVGAGASVTVTRISAGLDPVAEIAPNSAVTTSTSSRYEPVLSGA